MPNPASQTGTPPPGIGRSDFDQDPGKKNPNRKKGKGGASQPNVNDKGGKKTGGNKYAGTLFEIDAINPPFDPRIRRIGSPLNMTHKIKRGWIQSKVDPMRVNFLFNPSQLNVDSAVYDGARIDEQTPADDVMDVDYPSMGTKTGVKLLYDRTYELFSPPKEGEAGFANRYGVWADVAAWYVFLGMLPEMPESWEESMIVDPMQRKTAYLFVGPRMLYYGWVTNFSVVYSHWTQDMVPSRCAIDIGFEVLPNTEPAPYKGGKDFKVDWDMGWLGDWKYSVSPDGSVTDTGGASGSTNVAPDGAYWRDPEQREIN